MAGDEITRRGRKIKDSWGSGLDLEGNSDQREAKNKRKNKLFVAQRKVDATLWQARHTTVHPGRMVEE